MNAFMNHECRAPQGHLRTSVQLDFLLRAPAARAIELVRMACRVFNRDPCVCTYYILSVLPTATGLGRWGIRLLTRLLAVVQN